MVQKADKMTVRDGPKSLRLVQPPAKETASTDLPLDPLSQSKRPEIGRYRLEVDRQMKRSFTSFEEAAAAGLAIKTKHPIVRVAIYDAIDGVNTGVELPTV